MNGKFIWQWEWTLFQQQVLLKTARFPLVTDNSEIMGGFNTGQTIEECFGFFSISCASRYQVGLEQSMKGSNFVFDNFDGFYCKYNKISIRPRGYG